MDLVPWPVKAALRDPGHMSAPPATSGPPRRRGVAIGIAALVLVVAVALVGYLLVREDDGSTKQEGTPATGAAPTTTAVAPTTGVETSTAVWPFVSSATRYPDPLSAARGFATDYVGFTDPVVGEFRQGDTRSGEVLVQAKATGPTTTVFVRQLGDSWWVLGASTPNIQLTTPAAGSPISSPVRLAGTSTAFEATVNVAVRAEGDAQPIGTGIVMGGSMGALGPFDGVVSFTRPSATKGALVLLTRSAEDGSVAEATVVRVTFADDEATPPA
jgi:Immunoglobulin-like domain of bacterial spore germination